MNKVLYNSKRHKFQEDFVAGDDVNSSSTSCACDSETVPEHTYLDYHCDKCHHMQ